MVVPFIEGQEKPETVESESDQNEVWEKLESYLGDITKLVGSVASHTSYLLNLTGAADRQDLEQEATISLFNAWQRKNS